jgi:amidohydrolase
MKSRILFKVSRNLHLTGVLSIITLVSYCQTEDQLKETAQYSFEIYKQIHTFPELGKKEFKTSELIKKELQQMGFTEILSVPNLPTCIIAGINTMKSGPTIAFRAELDARPGKENTGLEYSSRLDSIVHSCGHDAHASILLGAAKLLFLLKKNLKGKIYFIFQPAEETKGGADDIVNSGILQTLKIENVFALHSVSGMPVGKINISPGYVMAGSNYFTIEIEGKGSHAATPQEGSNVPVLTSRVVQDIVSIPIDRMDTSARPCVISVTYIQTGTTNGSNVIPSKSIIKGTIRAYEPIDSVTANQISIQNLLENSVNRLCKAKNATCIVKITPGSPPNLNNEGLYNSEISKLKKTYSGTVDLTPYKGMFSEDFSYYTESIPCLYFGLGVAKGSLGNSNIHSNEFSVHPDSFIYGIELFCDLAFNK